MNEYYVKADDDGVRLDRWIKRNLPQISFILVAKWARTGQLRVDGKRSAPGDRLSTGNMVRLPPIDLAPSTPAIFAAQSLLSDLETEEAEAMVIHRDSDCIVLNKPPGLATQGGTGTTHHVDRLLSALCFEKADKPRLVHRLDKDTSGVLLLARTAKAAAFFSEHFRGRTAQKTYWALLLGVPHLDDGLISAPLAKQLGTGGEKMCVDEKNGLAAKTEYQVLERAGNRAAWVELRPLTGRTHQLRIHCATIGHAIVGDAKYAGKEAFLTGGISRKMHLHARRLQIPHPAGHMIDVVADLPTHMLESFEMLGFETPEHVVPEFDPLVQMAKAPVVSGKPGSAKTKRSFKEKPANKEVARRAWNKDATKPRRGGKRSK